MAGMAAVADGATVETPEVVVSAQPAPAMEIADLPPGDEDPPQDPNGRFKWLIPALIGAVAIVVLALFAFGVLDGTENATAAPANDTPPDTHDSCTNNCSSCAHYDGRSGHD